MKKTICLLLAFIMTMFCAFAYAEERDLPEGRVNILSRMTMEVPNGHSANVEKDYAKVFPYSGDEDRDSLIKVYYKEEVLDPLSIALIPEQQLMEAVTELSKSSLSTMQKKSETRDTRTVLGIENCQYYEVDFTMNNMFMTDDYKLISILVPKDGGSYIFTIRSKSEEKANEMFELLDTIEWNS